MILGMTLWAFTVSVKAIQPSAFQSPLQIHNVQMLVHAKSSHRGGRESAGGFICES